MGIHLAGKPSLVEGTGEYIAPGIGDPRSLFRKCRKSNVVQRKHSLQIDIFGPQNESQEFVCVESSAPHSPEMRDTRSHTTFRFIVVDNLERMSLRLRKCCRLTKYDCRLYGSDQGWLDIFSPPQEYRG